MPMKRFVKPGLTAKSADSGEQSGDSQRFRAHCSEALRARDEHLDEPTLGAGSRRTGLVHSRGCEADHHVAS